MKERIICCFYILFAKQYAVFTADKDKAGKYTSCYIKGDKIFLAAVANYLKKSSKGASRKGGSDRKRIEGGQRRW